MYLYSLMMFLGCLQNSRTNILVEQLWEDNKIWFFRNPSLVQSKFEKMTIDPYNFMRGTLRLHLFDIQQPAVNKPKTNFVSSPSHSQIFIVGDPHPENLALCVSTNGQHSAEYVDFDSSDYGPWHFDLRRAAMAFRVLVEPLEGCNCAEQAIEAMVEGYIQGVNGEGSFSGSVFDNLYREAKEEGRERKKFNKYTTRNQEGNLILADSLAELTQQEQLLAEKIVHQFGQTKTNFRLLDTRRRFGQGISSLPAIRLVVLWDQGEEGIHDDRLTMFRELTNPPPYTPTSFSSIPFDTNAHRIAWAATQLWERSNAINDHLGWSIDGHDFKSMEYSSWTQDPDHEKIEQRWQEETIDHFDIIEFARDAGWTLGKTQRQSVDINGKNAAKIILQDISDNGEHVLLREMVDLSAFDHARLMSDYGLFLTLIDNQGLSLGFTSPDTTW